MKKLLLTLALLIALSASASAASVSDFVDVKQGDWFYDAVVYALEYDMTTGKSATEFVPHSTTGRAEFVTLLSRLAGNEDILNSPNSTPYEDNKGGWWFTPHINWAEHFGITDTTGTEFRIHDPITRAEMAIFLGKYIEVIDITLPESTEAPAQFADADQISSAAAPYAELCRKYGLIVGNANGEFKPESSLTRAEAFTIGMRVHKILAAYEGEIEVPTFIECQSFQIKDPHILAVGEAYQMAIAYFVPANCTVQDGIIWTSWDESDHVATVTADGLVTAHSEGSATIYATHPNGYQQIAFVTVRAS